MSKLPENRPLRLEIFKDVPDYVTAIATTLNKFMRDVVRGLASLTFSENFAARVQEFVFSTGAAYTTGSFAALIIRNTTGQPVSGVLLLHVVQTSDPAVKFLTAPSVSNWSTDQSEVRIDYVTGLLNNTKYTLTVLVF